MNASLSPQCNAPSRTMSCDFFPSSSSLHGGRRIDPREVPFVSRGRRRRRRRRESRALLPKESINLRKDRLVWGSFLWLRLILQLRLGLMNVVVPVPGSIVLPESMSYGSRSCLGPICSMRLGVGRSVGWSIGDHQRTRLFFGCNAAMRRR